MNALERRLCSLEQRLFTTTGSAVLVMLDGETPQDAVQRLGVDAAGGYLCVMQVLDVQDWCQRAKVQQAELLGRP